MVFGEMFGFFEYDNEALCIEQIFELAGSQPLPNELLTQAKDLAKYSNDF